MLPALLGSSRTGPRNIFGCACLSRIARITGCLNCGTTGPFRLFQTQEGEQMGSDAKEPAGAGSL